MHFCCSKK